ncbi:pollen-specific leucine-rich repeat extensin-like protein 1 [Gambusia affinis]|uniref:pollen-specific leucine-rich repeat extensin-like protein 1 n=1 Tax=Gambusia affinis TaxID=33528 RepID=UPI001CDC0332|nr:pollen-specific leucine-rich repeat extensin-like protein 1 [Gambusia affinis]XP_043960746.1 pollen-specific leucine-rich repeat extensin-like protein 1 [Gambusia affinis]XP_043960747.1 pollen-specific leucine-rich repeat extensin-like protein 1 [Gambusia affinis]XP_043960748.1 pollen-specific leucine-rich repeat extensin-like protein 1 [Gambusia affinis]
MALPADGSPVLEGHPDNGKDHGKVWSNDANMVSEDHGEGLRCRSPPQSVDCPTSSSKDEVGNAGTTSSSGSSTTSSSEDEADNEDQDDFKSRLCFIKVLVGKLQQSLKSDKLKIGHRGSAVHRASAASQLLEIRPPNFKDIEDIGVAGKPQEDTTPCTSLEFTSKFDKEEEPILCPENSRPIGTTQHHQVGLEKDRATLTSRRARSISQKVDSAKEDDLPSKLSFGTVLPSGFKFTSGLDKQEEPILRPKNSRPIGTSQHHQVGLEKDRASLTSRHARSISQKVDSAKEDDLPSKLSFGTVLPSSFKFTSGLDQLEDPILRPEDSSPVSASPQPLAGWRNLVAFWTAGRARRTTKKVDDAKEDDPPSKSSDQVGLKEDVAPATSVTGISGKRTKDFDAEEQSQAKRSKDTLAEEELPKKWTRDSDDAKLEPSAKRIREIEADDEPPSKRTRDTVAEVKPPSKSTRDSVTEVKPLAKRTRNSNDPKQEPSAKRIRENQTEDVLPSKRTRDSVAEEEPPAKRTRDTAAKEELPAKTTDYSDDPGWDDILQRIGRRMAWRYGKEWENEPIPSTPLFIAYRKTDHEDPILLSPIHSPSPRTSCEDPGLSSPVLSPSYRMACKLPVLLSPIHSPSPRTSCGDPGLSSPVLSPSCKMPRERPVSSSPVLSPLRGTMHEDPFLSSPDVSPSPSTHCEDPPVLSPRVFSPPMMPCEDLILSPRVFSPSPSTHCENPTLSSPGFRFWMETEKDIEEEQTPSTSGGTTARESSRHVWFRPRYVLSSDSD